MKRYFIVALGALMITGAAMAGGGFNDGSSIIKPAAPMDGGCPPVTADFLCGEGTGTPPFGVTVRDAECVATNAVFPANTCSKTGYVFAGWWLYPDGGVWQPGDVIPISIENTDRMFYALWTEGGGVNTPTSSAFVDAKMGTVQNAFAGSGSDKLMTYPTTAGGTPGSRDIVSTLGTPDSTTGQYSNTSDDTIATRGAVVAGINRKQDTLDGTSGYAVTGTGADGVVGQKAIYGSGAQFNDALVETGTVNTAVINAVNSELIRVNENGVPDANGTLWQINGSLTLLSTGTSGN